MSSHIELSNGRDTVKIYTSSARGKPLFQVSFYKAGRRERRSFANRAKAKREAKLILTQLGSTASDAEKAVTTPEVESLVAARKALEGVDCPLHIAVEGFAKATKALGAPVNPVASLLEAVAFYRKHNPENAERIPLKDLTERFVKSRRSRGLSESWIQTCKGMMEALVKKFPDTGCDLPKGADVAKWLEERYENPTTRNSILKKFKTLASWAKRQRLVSHETISDIEFWKVQAGEVAIYTPEEMKQILTGMPSEMVPIVAICAYAGVRVSEAFRLDWKDISLERGYITVAATKTKTAAETHASVQVKIDHWSGFEGIVGTLQNFSIDGNRLRADLHLLDNHPARARVLEMAEKMPGGFGLSIVFIGDSETINGEAFARCNELFSVDLVDRPAANPTGLFSSGNAELVELRRKHLAEIETYRGQIHTLELKALEREAALIDAQRKVELLTRRCEQITRDTETMASRMAAEIVASTGTRMPAAISAKGDERPRSNLSGLDLAKAANTNRHNKQNP